MTDNRERVEELLSELRLIGGMQVLDVFETLKQYGAAAGGYRKFLMEEGGFCAPHAEAAAMHALVTMQQQLFDGS